MATRGMSRVQRASIIRLFLEIHFKFMKVWLIYDLSLGREKQEMGPKSTPHPLALMQS